MDEDTKQHYFLIWEFRGTFGGAETLFSIPLLKRENSLGNNANELNRIRETDVLFF